MKLKKIIALVLTAASVVSSLVVPTSAVSSSKVADKLDSLLPVVTYAAPSSGASKVYAYSDSSLSSRLSNYIDTFVDQIVITDISSNGQALKVAYPTSKGTKTLWFRADDILGLKSVSVKTYTASAKSTTYRLSSASRLTSYGSIAKNDSCTVLGAHTYGGYELTVYPISRTTVNGQTVSRKLALAKSSSSSSTSSSSSSKRITLAVPTIKQNDSRWRDVKIGTKTIGAIGCTTTCVSMLYSYHTGRTVTPDQMKNKLDYLNNDLIWSSLSDVGLSSKSYNSGVTSSMLSTIYSKLKSGRPVIIGATTSNGDYQHWVVINGYTGSGSNHSTSDFTVVDPGTVGYTTLASFLANGSKTDRTLVKRIVY